MDWLNDAWSGVKSFFGGGQSDEEKRRKAEEAKRRAEEAARQKQQQKTQKPTFTVPTVTKQPSPFAPQQQDKRPTAENPFMLDINKPKEQPIVKPKVEPLKFDKSEAEQISGFYVMSPEAQKVALNKLRAKGGTPEERLSKAKDALKSGDKNKVQNVVGGDMDLFKKASDALAAEKKAEYENTKKTIGNIPVLGTAQNWGAGLAAMYGKATGNKELEDRANNERNLLSLGMTTEELNKYDPKTQEKLKNLQNVVTGLGVLDVAGVASLAKAPLVTGGKEILKAGVKSQAGKTLLKEAVKQTGKQYKNNVIGGVAVGGVADPAVQAYIKDGEVDWTSVPSSMLQGGLWAAALPEFSSKQKLVQKLQAGDVLTPDESKLLNQALRDAEGKDIPTSDEELSHVTKTDNLPSILNDGKVNASKLQDTEGLQPFEKLDAAYLQKGTKPVYSHPDTSNVNIIYKRSSLGDIVEQGDEVAKMGGVPNAAIDRIQVPNQAVADAVTKAGYKAEIVPELDTTPKAGSADGVQRMLAQADEPKEVIPEVQVQAAQQAEGGSNNRGISMEEVMNNLRERNRVYNEADPATKAEIDARARQSNPDDVSLESPWSREAVYGDLTGMGLTPQDIANLTQRYGMTAQDWRAVMNATGNTGNARSLPALFDSQIRKVLNKERVQQAAPETAPDGRFVETPQGTVDTTTGEIIDTPPAGGTPPVDAPEQVSGFSEQLSAAEELAVAVQRARQIVNDLNESVKSLGFDPEELRRKMQMANRGDYTMTADEAAAASIYSNRLTQAREQLAESGLSFEGEQMFYTPQVRKGEAGLPQSREDLQNFGYANSRKNAMELDELDFGDMPQIDYIVRAENRNLLVEDSLVRAAEADGRMITREQSKAAASDTIKLQEKMKSGNGSEAILKNDTVSDLNKIGVNEGYAQSVNPTKAGFLSQEPMEMLNRAGVYNSGFQQYDNAVGNAYEFGRIVAENNIPREQLGEALANSLRSANPNADQSSIDEAVSSAIRRIMNRELEGDDMLPVINSAYRQVAKADLFKLGKTTSFSDPKMQAVVNEQMNARLMQDLYSKNFAQELDSFIAQRINASLRGGNVVSALYELGDVANIMSNYGVKNLKNAKFGLGKVDGDMMKFSRMYGQTDAHYLSADIPQINRLNEIWSNDKTNLLQKIKQSYEAGENKLLLFRYVEQYKNELFFRQADNYWRNERGLRGTELTNQVMQDFHKTMLPNSIITANRLIGKLPKSLTQYLNWSVQATKRFGRTVAGTNEAGVYRDMSRGSRIARGVSTELAPKVATAAILGVPVMQVLGFRDWTGATEGDYTGIDDEDKNALDNIMGYLSLSPTLGVASSVYYAGRREQEAVEDGEEANPNWFGEALAKESTKLIPFNTQIQKTLGMQDAVNKGYSENRDGRVQYVAPEAGSLEHIMGLVTGKNMTQSARDYADNPDIMSVLRGEASLADLFTHNQSIDNAVQTFGGDTARDYSRPLSNNDFVVGKNEDGSPITFNFNQTTKDAFANEGREAGINRFNQGDAYNEPLDALRRDNPKAYEAYQNIMDNDDLVSPEYWSELIGTNSEGGIDLTLVNMIGDRKRAVAAASNSPLSYDPMYDLPDDQLRAIVQYKSTATGDDIALRNILNKADWYKQYKENRNAYYDAMPEPTDNESRQQTERVKQWNAYSDQLDSLTMLDTPELQQQFPVTAAYNKAQAAYEEANPNGDFYEAGGKAFYQTYGDQLKAEKAAANAMKLEVINQMRVIEGFPPMTADQYAQATEIADTSGSGSGGSGGRSGGGGGSSGFSFIPEFYSNFKATDMPTAGTKPKVVAFNPNTSVGRRTNSRKTVGARSSGRDNGGYSL